MRRLMTPGIARPESTERILVMAPTPVHGKADSSHIAVVDALAKELQLPAERVAGAYFEELARLEESARIKTFVSVLAVGAVRSGLRRRGSDDAQAGAAAAGHGTRDKPA
jgi:hypothetical protein